jgi:tetratricopeptide (TPR) repeat protein
MRFLKRGIILVLFLCLSLLSIAQNSNEQLAVQYFASGEYEKAISLLEPLYEKRPESYFYTYLLQSYIEINDFRKAERLAKKQSKRFPQLARYQIDLGFVYDSGNQPAKAKKEYEDAIKKIPNNQFYIRDLANAFINRRQNDYAIQTYLNGRKILKDPKLFTYEIAAIYERNGKYHEALEEYFSIIDGNVQEVFNVQNRLQSLLLKDEDNEIYNTLRVEILKKTQKNPDRLSYALLMMWLSVQNLDFETALMQAKAIDRRFKEEGDRVFDIAKICVEHKNWDIAIDAYQYVMTKGKYNPLYTLSQVEILKAKYFKITESYNPFAKSNIKNIEQEFEKTILEIGFNPGIADLIRYQANINAFYLDNDRKAITLLDSLISYPGIAVREKALAKVELADILLYNDEVWDAVLLYGQVEKDFPTDTIGQWAKLKSAKLSFYIGEFEWARAQLDILRAATTRLIANDAMQLYFLIDDNLEEDEEDDLALRYYAQADLLLFKKQYDKALTTLDSIFALGLYNPIFDDAMYKKAEIYISKEMYHEADSILNKLTAFYPNDLLADDALFLRAEIQHFYLKNRQKAMDLYQEFLVEFPGNILSEEARKRFRNLRGDNLE